MNNKVATHCMVLRAHPVKRDNLRGEWKDFAGTGTLC